MRLTSPAFEHGQRIPTEHTADGQDLSPPLAWSDVPAGTQSLALICDDPDAPRTQPWVHWVVWDIPPQMTQLLPGLPRHASVSANGITRARQGANSWLSENIGYRGPAPPEGHGVHHYRFRLYALDTRLKLRAGATKDDLLRAARQHVLGEAELVGTYERPG